MIDSLYCFFQLMEIDNENTDKLFIRMFYKDKRENIEKEIEEYFDSLSISSVHYTYFKGSPHRIAYVFDQVDEISDNLVKKIKDHLTSYMMGEFFEVNVYH